MTRTLGIDEDWITETRGGKQYRLTDEAQAEREDFISCFEDSGCTCFISPPCSYCTHPGHPSGQEDDSCWILIEPTAWDRDLPQVMIYEAESVHAQGAVVAAEREAMDRKASALLGACDVLERSIKPNGMGRW